MEQGDATVDPAEDDTQPLVTRYPEPDTGDLINPYAPDARPGPVDDPADPSWVEAADDAVLVDPDRLLPADPPYESELPPGDPYPRAVGVASPVGLPPVGTSLPAAPDLTAVPESLGDHLLRDQQLPADRADLFPDPERDPEGHA